MKAEKQLSINVLMATYNTPFEMSKRAIKSVLNQDFQDFKLIIIDDGSDQDISTELQEYALQHPGKISYIRHENQGQSFSINQGIKLSNSKYTCIIDADDEYKPNHLSSCLAAMESYDLIATHTDTIINNPDDYYVPDKNNNKKNIHVDDCILFATLFGKTKIFKETIFENRYAADSKFYEQASKKYRVTKLPTRTYIYYRNNADSITAKMKKDNEE